MSLKFPKFFRQSVTNHGNFTVPGNCCLLVTNNNSPESGKFPWLRNKKDFQHFPQKGVFTENKKGVNGVKKPGWFFMPGAALVLGLRGCFHFPKEFDPGKTQPFPERCFRKVNVTGPFPLEAIALPVETRCSIPKAVGSLRFSREVPRIHIVMVQSRNPSRPTPRGCIKL